MPNRSPEVDEFLRELSHPLQEGVAEVRDAILASDDGITEHIKWKAPSFCHEGDDRVTFRLGPSDSVHSCSTAAPRCAPTATSSRSRTTRVS